MMSYNMSILHRYYIEKSKDRIGQTFWIPDDIDTISRYDIAKYNHAKKVDNERYQTLFNSQIGEETKRRDYCSLE